jgi:hypothetical protein
VPEGMNVEVAHKLSEHERADRAKHRWQEVLEVLADAASTLGGQELVADSSMFNSWLQARGANDPQLQVLFARRFTPEYRSAFQA